MSKKQWMVLLMLFVTYLLLGASIFYHIESRLEIERLREAKRERIEINALLSEHYTPSREHDYEEILGKLTRYCGKSVYNYTEDEMEPLKWDFYNSFYFAYTVVSTIGYGNLAPTNMLGRILMIFYGLVGIPMNGILLTQLGEFFGHVFVKAHRKYKSYKHGSSDYYAKRSTSFETRKFGLAAQIFAYLMPGFVMFIFFPAFLFSHYEGWSYDEAVYYAFVTLTTIGFGDYVAGQDNSKGSGIFFILYKTFLICWISFGLGYIVMIMTFIARGMRSKKITRIEHKLAVNLKHTQSKIWNEFNKEMNYLRRIFNELQLSKVKRVYVDECEYDLPTSKLLRSNSFPDLRELAYGGSSGNAVNAAISVRPRRRANSEVVPTGGEVARVASETDLQRIDKTATFAAHAMVQPAELLARLINVLGYVPPTSEDATVVNGVASGPMHVERELNMEERGMGQPLTDDPVPSWTIGNDRIAPRFSRSLVGKPRSRAASEIRLHERKTDDRNVEWTWSGSTASSKIQELTKARARAKTTAGGDSLATDRPKDRLPDRTSDRPKDLKPSRFRTFALGKKSVPKVLLPPAFAAWKRRFSIGPDRRNPVSDVTENEGSYDHDYDYDYDCHYGKGVKSAVGQSVAPHPAAQTDSRRDSDSTSASKRHYYTHTGVGGGGGGGGAAAAAGSDLAAESSNLLEETSLADFLRALSFLRASVDTVGDWTDPDRLDDQYQYQTRRAKPRRKMGTASLTPPKLPSLFTLFSSPPVTSTRENGQIASGSTTTSNGRLSLGLAENKHVIDQRGSAVIVKPRRFSLRPVATPVGPPTPPTNGSPFLSNSRRDGASVFPRKSVDDHGLNRAIHLFESPKEPLIRTDPTPGNPFANKITMKPPFSNSRRASTRPSRNQSIVHPNAAVDLPSMKVIPRWKVGIVHRQIGQVNLRHRVRAFSLSDVQSNSAQKHADSPDLADDAHTSRMKIDATRKNDTLREHSTERTSTLPSNTVSGNVPFNDNFISATAQTLSFSDSIAREHLTNLPGLDLSLVEKTKTVDVRQPDEHPRGAGIFDADERAKGISHESLLEVKVDKPVLDVLSSCKTTDTVNQHIPNLEGIKIQVPEPDFR